MDGLPIDTDFSPLVGRFIEVLRISKYQVHLFLNDAEPSKPDAWIEIGGQIIFTDAAAVATVIDDYRIGGGLVCLLLGLTIESASRRDDGGLTLQMSTSIRLDIVNDLPNCEAVVLHVGDQAIVG